MQTRRSHKKTRNRIPVQGHGCGENQFSCPWEVQHHKTRAFSANLCTWITMVHCLQCRPPQYNLMKYHIVCLYIYIHLNPVSVVGIYLICFLMPMQKLHWSFDWRWSRHNTCSRDEHSRPLQTRECLFMIVEQSGRQHASASYQQTTHLVLPLVVGGLWHQFSNR